MNFTNHQTNTKRYFYWRPTSRLGSDPLSPLLSCSVGTLWDLYGHHRGTHSLLTIIMQALVLSPEGNLLQSWLHIALLSTHLQAQRQPQTSHPTTADRRQRNEWANSFLTFQSVVPDFFVCLPRDQRGDEKQRQLLAQGREAVFLTRGTRLLPLAHFFSSPSCHPYRCHAEGRHTQKDTNHSYLHGALRVAVLGVAVAVAACVLVIAPLGIVVLVLLVILVVGVTVHLTIFHWLHTAP